MDHFNTSASQDDGGSERLTVAEVGLFALLCLMSVATVVTLAIKG